jgi:hypothetical protein
LPVWIAVSLCCLAATPISATAIEVTGDAARAESGSFRVVSYSRNHDAREAARTCEQWRAKLARYWCDQDELAAWMPKCDLVIHTGKQAYLAVVGPGGGPTYGSSLLDFGKDKQVSKRRIDVRGDSPLGMAALPHEMTHVILADLLGGRQPPRWADEGMAMLADTKEKQLLHERDLAQGLVSGRAFRLAELLAIDAYPHASRVPAFYGQSVSVTAYLALRDDPAKFVEFLRRCEERGHDEALRKVYAIDGVAHLERLWREERSASRTGYHGVRLSLDEAAIEVVGGTE